MVITQSGGRRNGRAEGSLSTNMKTAHVFTFTRFRACSRAALWMGLVRSVPSTQMPFSVTGFSNSCKRTFAQNGVALGVVQQRVDIL